MTERFADFMYWNRKAETGQIDGFIKSNRKNCDGAVCLFNVLEQKSRGGQFDEYNVKPKAKNIV